MASRCSVKSPFLIVFIFHPYDSKYPFCPLGGSISWEAAVRPGMRYRNDGVRLEKSQAKADFSSSVSLAFSGHLISPF